MNKYHWLHSTNYRKKNDVKNRGIFLLIHFSGSNFIIFEKKLTSNDMPRKWTSWDQVRLIIFYKTNKKKMVSTQFFYITSFFVIWNCVKSVERNQWKNQEGRITFCFLPIFNMSKAIVKKRKIAMLIRWIRWKRNFNTKKTSTCEVRSLQHY